VADGDSSGAGVGDAFLRFDLLFDVELGDAVGEVFFCCGELSGAGPPASLCEALRAGVGVDFFFRCLRLGVGDGSKLFLIFVPKDS
jgi:hypothetical protein